MRLTISRPDATNTVAHGERPTFLPGMQTLAQNADNPDTCFCELEISITANSTALLQQHLAGRLSGMAVRRWALGATAGAAYFAERLMAHLHKVRHALESQPALLLLNVLLRILRLCHTVHERSPPSTAGGDGDGGRLAQACTLPENQAFARFAAPSYDVWRLPGCYRTRRMRLNPALELFRPA